MTTRLTDDLGGRCTLPKVPTWVERRHEGRVVVSIGLSVRERHYRARQEKLLDLSRKGCRVRNKLLVPGQKIWVTLDGLSAIEATAIWCQHGEVGIAFDVPLYPAVLDHLIGTHSFRLDRTARHLEAAKPPAPIRPGKR